MALLVWWLLLILQLTLFTNGKANDDSSGNYYPHIAKILDYLNSNPERIYNYNSGKLISAQNKDSLTVYIVTDIEVQCLHESNDAPCTTKVVTCEGEVQFKSEISKYEVLPPINCNPKTEQILQSEDERTETTRLADLSQNEDKNKEEVYSRSLGICTGCVVDLNKNVDGLQPLIDTALKHIESERSKIHMLIHVLRVQQQVVAGTKYILLLEVATTVCNKDVKDQSLRNCPLDTQQVSEYCQIEYLQQLWKSRGKHIISNNCTESQDFKATTYFDDNSFDNEVDPYGSTKIKNKVETDFEQMAQTGQIDELNPSQMAFLESQIIQDRPRKIESVNPTAKVMINTDNSHVEAGYEDIPSIITSTIAAVDCEEKRNIFTDEEKSFINAFFRNFFFDEQIYIPIVQSTELQNSRSNEKNLYESLKLKSLVNEENQEAEEQRKKRHVHKSSKESSRENAGIKTKSSEEESSETSEGNVNESTKLQKKIDKREVHKTSAESSEESNETSEEKSKIRLKRSVKDDNNNSEEQKRENLNDISSSSSSSEENRKNKRNKRSNNDSRANSSLEKNVFYDESSNLVLRNYSEKYSSSEEKKEEEDSITRHKRDTDSSSSSSSSSSDDDDDNDNNEKSKAKCEKVCTKNDIDDDNNEKSKAKCEKVHTKNDNDNDSSSSSSSSSSEDDNDNKKKKNKRSVNVNNFENIEEDDKTVVENLAQIAAATLDDIDDDNQKRVVLNILGAKKIKLEGYVYYLTLSTGVSLCIEDSNVLKGKNLFEVTSNQENQCRKSLIEDSTKICRVQIHVSEKYTNPKVIKTHCFISEKNNRNKRQLVGGISSISISDPKVLDFTQQTLKKLDAKSPHENKYKVVEILSASRQLVAGSLYRIKATIILSDCTKSDFKDPQDCGEYKESMPHVCEIQVWDRPWLPNGREINVTCNEENHVLRSKRSADGEIEYLRSKKSPQILGGISNTSVNDPTILDYTKTTLSQLDQESSHDNKYKVVEILSASRQVVSGILYRIEAKIVVSDCPKASTKDSQLCGMLKEAEPKTCNIEIWDQPWLANGRKTKVTCDEEKHTFKSKRSTKNNHKLHLLGKNDYDQQLIYFKGFMEQYNKIYHDKEEMKYRFKVFRKNFNKMRLLNKYEKGTGKYGITKFSDLTTEEFKTLLGYRPDLVNENELKFSQAEIPNINLPEEFDWRKQGVVTEVKDQGSCGSCWAFSVTGNVEGQYAIKHKKLLQFSEQELVDCDKYDAGCNGGLMDNAYRAIEQIGGLESEQDYPYDAENEKCHFNKTLAKVQLSGAVNISQDETDMAKWLVQNGPISIAINANAMQFYMGGVSHPWRFLCNPKSLDHGVLIIGYGVHKYPRYNKTLPYWLVKNSWGKSWGEQGYYMVYRGDGTCGVNQTPSSAIVE